MGLLWQIIVTQHSLPLHQEMQLEIVLCKEIGIHEISLGPKLFEMMVWRCISYHGMGELHICEGTIDAEAYVGILETYAARRQLFPGIITICEGKVKEKDPDAHRSESERYLLGAGKIVVINRRGSE